MSGEPRPRHRRASGSRSPRTTTCRSRPRGRCASSCGGGRRGRRGARPRDAGATPVEPPDAADLLFDSGKGLWRLYRDGRRTRSFVFTSPSLGALPYQAARFNDDFTRGGGRALAARSFAARLPALPAALPARRAAHGAPARARARRRDPRQRRRDARRAGHAVRGAVRRGQDDDGAAVGAEPDVTIFSDERIILRQEGDDVWMYGTPWHGDGHIANPGRARLRPGVLPAPRARATRSRPCRRTDAIARLFSAASRRSTTRPASTSASASWARSRGACRCDELAFVPDRSAVEFARAS